MPCGQLSILHYLGNNDKKQVSTCSAQLHSFLTLQMWSPRTQRADCVSESSYGASKRWLQFSSTEQLEGAVTTTAVSPAPLHALPILLPQEKPLCHRWVTAAPQVFLAIECRRNLPFPTVTENRLSCHLQPLPSAQHSCVTV